jgi:hypothetical protein
MALSKAKTNLARSASILFENKRYSRANFKHPCAIHASKTVALINTTINLARSASTLFGKTR